MMTEEDLVIRRRQRVPLRLAHVLEGAGDADMARYRASVENEKHDITTDFYLNKKGAVSAIQGDSNLERDYFDEVDVLQDTISFGYEEGFIDSAPVRSGRSGIGTGAAGTSIGIESALQTAVGTLHQHDINDNQRDVDQNRSLRIEVERPPEADEAHLLQRRRHQRQNERHHETHRHQRRDQRKIEAPILLMRARHRCRDRRGFGRGIERSVRGVMRRGHAPMYQKATGQAIGIVRAVALTA